MAYLWRATKAAETHQSDVDFTRLIVEFARHNLFLFLKHATGYRPLVLPNRRSKRPFPVAKGDFGPKSDRFQVKITYRIILCTKAL